MEITNTFEFTDNGDLILATTSIGKVTIEITDELKPLLGNIQDIVAWKKEQLDIGNNAKK